MSGTIWVGVDPGYNATGYAVRWMSSLLQHQVVTRTTDEAIRANGVEVGPVYLTAVADMLGDLIQFAFTEAGRLDVQHVRVVVEDVTAPSPHVKRKDGSQRLTAPRYAIGAAKVVGVVEHLTHAIEPRADLVRVAPNRHGRSLLATYPDALVTDRERARGLNRLAQHNADVNHARSAWDIAGAGPAAARMQIATDITRAVIRRRTTQGDPK